MSNDVIFMLYGVSDLWCNKDYCSYIYVMDCLVVNVHLEQLAPFWFHAASAWKILFIPELHAFLQHSPNNSIFIIIILKELSSYSESFNLPTLWTLHVLAYFLKNLQMRQDIFYFIDSSQ